jgi:hypothetical protein
MIVDNFHMMRAIPLPHETNAPLGVDTDAVLSLAITLQSFQAVARRDFQVIQYRGGTESVNQMFRCTSLCRRSELMLGLNKFSSV